MPEIVDNKILRLLNVEVGFRRRLHKIARTWTFELFNWPSLEVVCYRRRSNPWHHTPKLWLWCWNTQESTTQAPKRAYDSLLIWSSRSSKRPFSFYLKSLSSPNISVYFIQDLDMQLFKLLSFFGFGFCAFLFDLVLLFWILCSLGSRFCDQSNLWFLWSIKFMIWTCYFYYFYDIRFNGDTF